MRKPSRSCGQTPLLETVAARHVGPFEKRSCWCWLRAVNYQRDCARLHIFFSGREARVRSFLISYMLYNRAGARFCSVRAPRTGRSKKRQKKRGKLWREKVLKASMSGVCAPTLRGGFRLLESSSLVLPPSLAYSFRVCHVNKLGLSPQIPSMAGDSHGARPVHLIITMIKWIRTSRLSIKNSLYPHP